MNISIIDQVIEQLKTMPQPLQSQVLRFAQTLVSSEIRGVPGQQLLQFAGTIPLDELRLMEEEISSEEGFANAQPIQQSEENSP